MKRILIIIALVNIHQSVTATFQVEDILIINSDTLFLYNSPLEQIDDITSKIFSLDSNLNYTTGCCRGFQAEWTIVDDVLYLLNVYECHSTKKINTIIEKVLERKFENGLLHADWVEGDFWAGKGRVLRSFPISIVFRHEYNIALSKGEVISISEFQYLPCAYSEKARIQEFVSQNISWEKLPKQNDKKVTLLYIIDNNNTGNITRITSLTPGNYRYKKHIKKVLKKLPCSPVYFYRGEYCEWGRYCEIEIDKIYIYVR